MDVAWTEVAAFAQQKLERLRNTNDGVELDAVKTAFIRGQIAATKELLALPKAKRLAARSDDDDPVR